MACGACGSYGTRGTCKTCGTGGTRDTCGTCGTTWTCGTCRTCQGGRPCSSDVWKLSPLIFQHAMFRRLARAASTRNAPRASLRRAHAIARPAHAETGALRANSTMSHPRATIVDEPAVVVDRRRRRSVVVTAVDVVGRPLSSTGHRRKRRASGIREIDAMNPCPRPQDPMNLAWIPTWILLRANSA